MWLILIAWELNRQRYDAVVGCVGPGQRHWPCTDRGDRSGAGLKSGVLMGREAIAKWCTLVHPGENDVRKIVYTQPTASDSSDQLFFIRKMRCEGTQFGVKFS